MVLIFRSQGHACLLYLIFQHNWVSMYIGIPWPWLGRLVELFSEPNPRGSGRMGGLDRTERASELPILRIVDGHQQF